MFDELHDDTPPTADSHQFAAVAERAAAIRRRRRALVGTVSAVALLAGGTAVVLSMDSGDDQRIATLDAAEPTTPADSSAATSTSPPLTDTTASPTTTAPDATTTSMPVTEPAVAAGPIVGEPIPLQCGGGRVCTFDHLADGRLVQIGKDGGESGPPTYSIYDQSGTTVESTGWLGNFDPIGAFLVDVGPGDIAYVWYLNRDESETARMGAFELTGPNAGRQITEFDSVLDFSGDTEQVPTRTGFVNVGCCGNDTVRPAPGAEVVIPWVDSDGNEITNDDDTFFDVEFVDQSLIVNATTGDLTRSWDLGWQEALPRGLPRFHQLADGRVLYLLDGLHSGGARVVPIYLDPDGSVDIGDSPGTIDHALPDGRVVLLDRDADTYSLVTLAQPPAGATVTTAATTTIPVPATPAPRPLVAITADGDAVYFETDESEPILLLDGPSAAELTETQEGPGPNVVDSVAVSLAAGRAFVGECCEPISGIVYETSLSKPVDKQQIQATLAGYGVSVSSDGTRLAVGNYAGVDIGIVVTDIQTGVETTYRSEPETVFSPYETMWFDDETVLLLGIGASGWELAVVDLSAPTTAEATVIPLPSDAGVDSTLALAGRPVDGVVGVHERGSSEVLLVDPTAEAEPVLTAAAITLPAPAQSAWFLDPTQLVWVDADGALRVGDRLVPGTYTRARR